MRFQLLGAVQGWAGDRPVSLGVRKQRFVLAVLALEANHLVPVARLVDLIWADRPPASARRMIHTYVSGLRAVLGRYAAGRDGVILSGASGGYQLHCDPTCIDSHRFQDLVVRARHADADPARVALLNEALGLWSGPALAGLCGEDARMRLCRHLEEARLAAIEDRCEAMLRLGHHHDLLDELTVMSERHPYRQRITAQLMLALHRAGLTADALRAYDRARGRLADELGLDPADDLQLLHRAILRGDPDVGQDRRPAGPRPAQLPAGTRHFAGRTRQLDELTRLLDDATGRTVVISAIGGTAGIGKTALALHWAHHATPRFPDGQLYVNLRGYDPTGPVTPAEAVRGFLDVFGVPIGRIPDDLAAQAALYRSLLADRRVLVVLDNARDAAQVRPLLPGTSNCMALVTSRSRISGLVSAEGAHPIILDLLTPPEAHELLAGHLGPQRLASEPAAVDRLIARCAGLPLALAIVAARAAAHPAFPLAAFADELDDVRGRLDAFGGDDPATDLRAVFGLSYRCLSTDAARLFRLLGLHPGPDIAPPAAASLVGVAPARIGELLAELARAHLIIEHAPGRYTFHDLLRAYAAEQAQATDATDAALHRVLDHYLHTAYASNCQLYQHRKSIDLPPARPGVTPEDIGDHGRALAWFTAEHDVLLAAVGQAAESGLDTHTWQLAWTIKTFLHWQGHWSDWAVTHEAALRAAIRLGDRTAQAYAHRSLSGACTRLGRHDDAHTHLEHALGLYAEIDDRINLANTHLSMAIVLERQSRLTEALDHAEQGLHLYRAVHDRGGQANALNNAGWYHALLGNHERALAYCEQALARFQELDNRLGQASAWDSLGYAHHQLGHRGQDVTCCQRAVDLFHQVGDRAGEADALTHLGDGHHAADRRDAAAAAWRQALAILDELGHPNADRLRIKLNSLPIDTEHR